MLPRTSCTRRPKCLHLFSVLLAGPAMVSLTYHVGEDFEHLLSCIRAVYEALEFIDLRDGNRSGCVETLDATEWQNGPTLGPRIRAILRRSDHPHQQTR